MLSFLLRPRVLVVLGLVAAGVVAFAVAAARSGSPGCTVGTPEVNLPPELRVIGGFDRPFDASDPPTMASAAQLAATTLHSDLAGAKASGGLVAETADGGDRHDALVVPLSEAVDAASPPRVVGLVSFLRDCSGRAWYSDVDDLLHTSPGDLPQRFPLVSASQASAQLGLSGGAAPELVWRTSPFAPLWLDRRSGRTVAAGPAQPKPA